MCRTVLVVSRLMTSYTSSCHLAKATPQSSLARACHESWKLSSNLFALPYYLQHPVFAVDQCRCRLSHVIAESIERVITASLRVITVIGAEKCVVKRS